MFYEGLAEYIESEVSGLKIAKNLFIGNMPATAMGVMVKPNTFGDEIDPELTGMRKAKVQVIARGSSYVKAKELAESVASVLNRVFETPLSDGRILVKSMVQTREAYGYPNSAGSLYEFSVIFSAIYVKVVQ